MATYLSARSGCNFSSSASTRESSASPLPLSVQFDGGRAGWVAASCVVGCVAAARVAAGPVVAPGRWPLVGGGPPGNFRPPRPRGGFFRPHKFFLLFTRFV